ncbi:hypothetical protein P7K49_017338, partial [Saguinus oedipus]
MRNRSWFLWKMDARNFSSALSPDTDIFPSSPAGGARKGSRARSRRHGRDRPAGPAWAALWRLRLVGSDWKMARGAEASAGSSEAAWAAVPFRQEEVARRLKRATASPPPPPPEKGLPPPRPRPPHPGAPCAHQFRRVHETRARAGTPSRPLLALTQLPSARPICSVPRTRGLEALSQLAPRPQNSGRSRRPRASPRLAWDRTRARRIAPAASAQLQTRASPWGQRLRLALGAAPANHTGGASWETRTLTGMTIPEKDLRQRATNFRSWNDFEEQNSRN